MENKKVFVVIEESVYDYENSTDVKVFSTKEKALEYISNLKKDNEDECLAEGWEKAYDYFDEFLFQEDGDYTRNHYQVWVVEKELG